MKNLKILMVALALLALPAVAFGQSVSCPDCSHDVSVFMGEGGLVATARDADKKVSYIATCSGIYRTGELTPDDDGMVSMLFNMDNGLACSATGKDMGSLEIGPVKDGGWYWITDDMNSAVGALVAKAVQGNDMVEITSAGDGVTMTAGTGAVYLKETATGRVGILPTIVVKEQDEPTGKCGYTGAFSASSPGVPKKTDCILGDGGTMIVATSTDAFNEGSVQIKHKGSVTRPRGTGKITIVADLWGNGTGHYVATHDADTANGISAGRGHAALAGVAAARAATRLTGVSYELTLGTVGRYGPNTTDTITSGTPVGGVDYTEGNSAATITIVAEDDYCSKDNNYTAEVVVTASMADVGNAAQVVPTLKRHSTGAVGGMSFEVKCPAASANLGAELVPENPFPTDE